MSRKKVKGALHGARVFSQKSTGASIYFVLAGRAATRQRPPNNHLQVVGVVATGLQQNRCLHSAFAKTPPPRHPWNGALILVYIKTIKKNKKLELL